MGKRKEPEEDEKQECLPDNWVELERDEEYVQKFLEEKIAGGQGEREEQPAGKLELKAGMLEQLTVK